MDDNDVNALGQPVGWSVDVLPAPAPSTSAKVGHFCTLVALDPDLHSAELFEVYSEAKDDGDWTYLSYGPFRDMDEFQAFTERYAGQNDPVFFTVVDGSSGRSLGVASYLRIDTHAASIEVGHIHFSHRLQRTPAATEAMYLMMEHAFESGYRRYEWKCDALNAPSRAAAARLGFTYEGTFRQATHYKGRNRDTAWFAITDAEWPALKAEFQRWLAADNFDEDGSQRSSLRCAPQ